MRHVPYAAAVTANGGEEVASMAISATPEENWFGAGSSGAQNGRRADAGCATHPEAGRLSDARGDERRSSGSLAEQPDDDEPSDDEVICGRSSGDKRSLIWSAFSATLIPSRRTEAGRPNRRRNPFRQRQRRPNLSNVAEAQHENGAGASEPGDSVGCGRGASVACEVSARHPRAVNGDAASAADLKCQAEAADSESIPCKTIPVCNAAIPAPTLKCAAVAVNGGADGESHIRRCGRQFGSLPEDEDSAGELDADCAERTELLERSASVPDAEAIRWTAKAMSMTSVADVSVETGDAVKRSHSSGSDASAGGRKLGKWSKSKIDLLVPSIKSLVTMTTNKLASSSGKASMNCRRRSGCSGSTNNLFASSSTSFSRFDLGTIEASPRVDSLRRNISLSCVRNGCRYEPMNIRSTDNLSAAGTLTEKLRKCNTMVALSGGCTVTANPCGAVHAEPMRPVNRLRVNSRELQAASRMCSRCSSLLSMASSSRYSLNSSYGFVPVSGVLCKVCLNEVPLKDSWTLQHCECSYCVDCVRSYVEFEINQGAYSISCPDAQCEKQGIIMLEEIESLVSLENHEKHKRYRLNKEVEMDKSRTWCPRAGCETVCTLCSADRCTPQSVHCPTCKMDFCSNCRAAWHADSPCKSEEVVPGVTFDSELIKCCPMCSVPIEKDEGCAQMLCKRCKHVFCWYCLASLDDDFLLRHYDKGPCKNKLGHSRASVIWHRTQVISIFAGFGILLLIASPLLLLAAPCIVCCKCRVCSSDTKLDVDDDLPEAAELQTNADATLERADDVGGSSAETHS